MLFSIILAILILIGLFAIFSSTEQVVLKQIQRSGDEYDDEYFRRYEEDEDDEEDDELIAERAAELIAEKVAQKINKET